MINMERNKTSVACLVCSSLASYVRFIGSYICTSIGKGIQFDIIVTLPESLAAKAEDLDFSFINEGAEIWKSLGKTTITPLESK